MSNDVDDAVDQLTVVTSGDSLASIPVVAVDEGPHEVTLTLELPSGDRFDDTFTKPPVWGPNCDLQDLLDHVGIGPDELGDLVGRRLPCDRSVRENGIEFYVDRNELSG